MLEVEGVQKKVTKPSTMVLTGVSTMVYGALMDTLTFLRKRLSEHPAPVKTIAAATGISPGWIQRFKAGDFKDPGYNRICRLRDYLTKEVA